MISGTDLSVFLPAISQFFKINKIRNQKMSVRSDKLEGTGNNSIPPAALEQGITKAPDRTASYLSHVIA